MRWYKDRILFFCEKRLGMSGGRGRSLLNYRLVKCVIDGFSEDGYCVVYFLGSASWDWFLRRYAQYFSKCHPIVGILMTIKGDLS